MSQGNDFANYSAASNAGTGGSDEVWFVAVASDDIKQMTIDQLDEAFRLGIITGETPVWTEGMEAWAPLAKVADLDGDSGSEARDANHAPGNTGTYGTASNGGSYGAAANGGGYGAAPNTGSYGAAANGGGYGAASNMGGYGAASNAGAYGAAGAGFGAVTLQSVQHSFAPGPSSVAPVTASYAPGPHAGQSPLPVAINGDEEVAPVPRGRGFRPARWLLAGAAAIAIGVVAYNNLSSSVASAGTEAAAPAALAARPYDSAEGAGSTSAGSARSNTSARGDGEAAA
ncbi:MAG TPA: DUF4339 domain-containing protein, partial [Polyangiaceae bacterium]|nr:DUF4339 domain-containing protein [Polyangiaceae bacterium]